MTRARVNHVSAMAKTLAESVRSYIEVFGPKMIDSPNFGFPVQWRRVGDLQLHLDELPGDPAKFHDRAFVVDDFEAVFQATRCRGIQDSETMGYQLNELPNGQVQL